MTVFIQDRRQRRKAIRLPVGRLRRIRTEEEKQRNRERNKNALYYVGVDGEGVTVDGVHRYVMLQWSDKTGHFRDECIDARGLSTVDCLEFLLAIPLAAKSFAYAFNYDLTKILVDLPDELLFRLFRPELRKRLPGVPGGPIAVQWGVYKLNLIGTKFSVVKDKRRRVVWDVFRFYQAKFTSALEKWQIGTPEAIAKIEEMKEKREAFHTGMLSAMSAYCYEECAYLAELVEKLDDAHERAGLELTNYYGAGSTAAALLKTMGIKDQRRDAGEHTDAMREAVAAAFFGGRFENSVVGCIDGPLYNYDICSAYPYQLRFLPCLEHGTWQHTRSRNRLDTARAALVSFSLGACNDMPWGPLPFRTDSGSVVFPIESGGGWTWRDEYLTAERLFPNVGFVEAWVYDCDCECVPFLSIPQIYLRRLELGKDGAGIVLKLGPNSCYGKLAQSVGSPQFQSWIWAGMITSGVRAQLLEVMGLHEDWNDVLAFATDSVVTRKQLKMPIPRDTATNYLLDGSPNEPSKWLGAWDMKEETRPVFLARPGIYFPLTGGRELEGEDLKKELEKMRARGIGRKALFEAGHKLVDAWKRGQYEDIDMGTIRRFCGAKTSTHGPTLTRPKHLRAPTYGQWIDRPLRASLNPLPKRNENIERCGDYGILRVRRMQGRSLPYRRALTAEALELRAFADQSAEQPEGLFDVQLDNESEQLD